MQSEKIGKSDFTSPNENEYNTEITGDRNKAGFYSDTIHSSDDKFCQSQHIYQLLLSKQLGMQSAA